MINAFKSSLYHKVVQLSVYQIPIGKLLNATARPGSVVVTVAVAPDVESEVVLGTQSAVDSGTFLLPVGEHVLTSVPMSPTPTVPISSTSAPLMCNGVPDSNLCAQMTCSEHHAMTICPAKCDSCVDPADATSSAPDASTGNGIEDTDNGASSVILYAVGGICGLLFLVAIGTCVELRKLKKAAGTKPGVAGRETIAFDNPMYTKQGVAPGLQASQKYTTVVSGSAEGYMTVDGSTSPPGTDVAAASHYLSQMMAYYTAYAPGTKTTDAIAPHARKCAAQGHQWLNASLKKKYGVSFDEFLASTLGSPTPSGGPAVVQTAIHDPYTTMAATMSPQANAYDAYDGSPVLATNAQGVRRVTNAAELFSDMDGAVSL